MRVFLAGRTHYLNSKMAKLDRLEPDSKNHWPTCLSPRKDNDLRFCGRAKQFKRSIPDLKESNNRRGDVWNFYRVHQGYNILDMGSSVFYFSCVAIVVQQLYIHSLTSPIVILDYLQVIHQNDNILLGCFFCPKDLQYFPFPFLDIFFFPIG